MIFKRRFHPEIFARSNNKKAVLAARPKFDIDFYARHNPELPGQKIDLFEHFIKYGWKEGRRPRADFDSEFYVRTYGQEVGDEIPFLHWVTVGRIKGYRGHPWIDAPDCDDILLMLGEFDYAYYAKHSPDVLSQKMDLFQHFLKYGWKEGRNPNSSFSVSEYAEGFPEIAKTGCNPFSHYLCIGRNQKGARSHGREAPVEEDSGVPQTSRGIGYGEVSAQFDSAFYREGFPPGVTIPSDLVAHYLEKGWLEGRDPNSWFSTRYYLEKNPDVEQSGIQPFVHYVTTDHLEVREIYPPKFTPSSQDLFREHSTFTAPGPSFEEPDRFILARRKPTAKALAFFLPQFHPIKENDQWWGTGFTEWRNCVRGQPRFRGHHQPRIPRDLGFYDLRRLEAMREQINLAKLGGVYGFCFYYYSFDGERLLEAPIDDFLMASDLEMPFSLIWANENWTRTWDGFDKEVLRSQNYTEDKEHILVSDIARHFKDNRYIRVDGKPLFFIYRPGLVPNSKSTFARWRRIWHNEYGFDPLIFMVQAFDDNDPRDHGLDGAIEFPPHKLSKGLPSINASLELIDQEFSGHVVSYDAVVRRSLDERAPEFPLIKSVTTCWDNEARRPGRGMMLHGASPSKYESWLREVVKWSKDNPVFGEAFVAINAWNEWAEGAYLEPDIYYGAAYLNATARALTSQLGLETVSRKILVVGHDAHPHGAQYLLLHIISTLVRQFGVKVYLILCGIGPLLDEYRKFSECAVITLGHEQELDAKLAALKSEGFHGSIVNTTVCGWVTARLKMQGFGVVALVHELSTIIRDYSLEGQAAAIAKWADCIFFPANAVSDSFLSIAGQPKGEVIIRPQGHYLTDIGHMDRVHSSIRKRFGIPQHASVIINVAYADSRKDFDSFVHIARGVANRRPDVYFIWVGDGTPDVRLWYLPESRSGILEGRFFFTGHVRQSELPDYYAAADLFLLTSREDPFPAVALAALAAGLPIVGFAGATGATSLISQFGRVVDRFDFNDAVSAIDDLLNRPIKEKERSAREARKLIREKYDLDSYCFELLQQLSPGLASVSAVIPNYNYANYLRNRLETVVQQSYPLFEIYVLDDKSTDNSVSVVRRFAEMTQREIKLACNEQNSGSVFRQWRSGVEQARGKYVWIAEADDVASPDLLGALVDALENSNAVIAFCDSWQIDQKGNRLADSYKDYVNQGAQQAFDVSFVMTGEEFIRRFLSIRNVILNVSGVLWRRDALLEALSEVGEELTEFKVAGDWRLYLEVCKAGKIAYVADALNGHRRHKTSVAHTLSKQRHYEEIVEMQRLSAGMVSLNEDALRAQAQHRDAACDTLGIEMSKK